MARAHRCQTRGFLEDTRKQVLHIPFRPNSRRLKGCRPFHLPRTIRRKDRPSPPQGPPMQRPPMQGAPMQGPPMQGMPMQGSRMESPIRGQQSPPVLPRMCRRPKVGNPSPRPRPRLWNLLTFRLCHKCGFREEPEEAAAKVAANLLSSCYDQLQRGRFSKSELQSSCDKFSTQYVALAEWSKAHGSKRWPIQPEFHLLQELVLEAASSPADRWTYRDDSFGGVMAAWSSRRGGRYSPTAVAQSLFARFAAQSLPRL